METIEAITTRRSIRKYKKASVPYELTKRLLTAAMSAPSAGNEKPWHFIVVTDRALLDEVPEIHPYSSMITQAPLAILICGDKDKEVYKGFWPQDCAAATQNLLLAAHASGLGCVWLGLHPFKDRVTKMQRLFGLPKNIIPFAIVPVGMPAERKAYIDRFDEARVHENIW